MMPYRIWGITDVSGQPIGPIFKGQAWPLKRGITANESILACVGFDFAGTIFIT